MYGECEQYGRANVIKRFAGLFKQKKGFITIGIDLPIESEEEM